MKLMTNPIFANRESCFCFQIERQKLISVCILAMYVKKNNLVHVIHIIHLRLKVKCTNYSEQMIGVTYN
jgi:hypothetical protein